MFRGIEKKRFFLMERVWFATYNIESRADIVRYLRATEPKKGLFFINDSVETVLTDLKRPIEDILQSATKTIRYEVSKCEKEEIYISFYTAKEMQGDKGLIDEFEKAYLNFAKSIHVKMVEDAYQRSKIENAIECNNIMLSKAEKDGVDVYHVYFCGGKECCLCYSVSNFRNDNTKRNLAGRMNKLLHVRDMQWFKESGYELYDWGNISSSESPNGIDIFKMSFGGKVVRIYNTFVGNTLKGKILVMALKMKGGRK